MDLPESHWVNFAWALILMKVQKINFLPVMGLAMRRKIKIQVGVKGVSK